MSPPLSTAAATTFQQLRVVLLSSWEAPALALAAVLAVVAVLLSARGYRRQRPRVRALLIALRTAAVACVLLVTLQPALRERSVTRLPNHIGVLVDLSASMAIGERRDGPNRLTLARALLERSEGRFRRWRDTRHVDLYGFHRDLANWPAKGAAVEATGSATRIRSVLEQVRGRYRGTELAAVVLISDGADNGRFGRGKLSAEHVRYVKDLGVPIHTVWIGSAEMKDLAVGPVHADDFAFVRNAVKVEAEVSAIGLSGTAVPVTLSREGVVVGRHMLRVQSDRHRQRISFEFVPKRVGKHVYTIELPVLPGESIEGNNQHTFMINVIRDRVRVLQVCGQPSWDERFLRRWLKREPSVDLISFFILRTPASLSMVSPKELSLIPFPTQELFEGELGSFDLVVLQNFNFGPYGIGAYLARLRDFVKRGGGLAMVGGDLSFTSGGYFKTPVSEVLPVRLLSPRRSAGDLISEDDFRLRLTARGQAHPILQLGASRERTRRMLAALPPLWGVNHVGPARSGAMVLATHPRLKSAGGEAMPVLSVREVGQGRTLALTTDSLWRWAFATVGQGGNRDAYDRFWRNAVRWLIRDPELAYVKILLRDDRIELGQAAEITVRVTGPDYKPAKGVKVEYVVEPLAKGKGLAGQRRTDSAGEIHLSQRLAVPGAYRVRAWATITDRKAQATEILLVEASGVEQQQPESVSTMLEHLAAVSGGRFVGQVERLPDLPFREPKVVRVNWTRDRELWNGWWGLAIAVLLLGLEWVARRRFGHY